MNAIESLTLTRFVRAVCPQQKFDEYTPDFWFKLLGDLNFADCEEALIELGKRQTFVSPAEIRAEVKRIRNGRLERAFEDMPELDAHRDDVNAWLAALRDGRRRTADGELQTDRPDLPKRKVEELMLKPTLARLEARQAIADARYEAQRHPSSVSVLSDPSATA